MKIGFTGTRKGLTPIQKLRLKFYLQEHLQEIEEVHHGDCTGADAEFHGLCEELRIKIVIHPPLNPDHRAFCKSDYILPVDAYLIRNTHIVDSCDTLLATPKGLSEEQRSGTWHAIRYALGKKPVHVFYNDGNIIYNLSKV